MKRISFLAVCLLPACTTTIREIRLDQPRATYQTERSVRALEHCLAGNLSWVSLPSVIHGEEGSELSFGGPGAAVILVTLTPLAPLAGTKVEVREKLSYGARVRRNVEACVEGRDT